MIEADSRIPGFLAVPGGRQHGSGRVPEADDGGDEPEDDSDRNDPATPAAAVVQPDSQREKITRGEAMLMANCGIQTIKPHSFICAASLSTLLYSMKRILSSKIISQKRKSVKKFSEGISDIREQM